MLIINNQTPIIYNQNFKYLPEPIVYNRKLYTMKPKGSSINKPGSKYSPAPVIYNRSLFKTGATDLQLCNLIITIIKECRVSFLSEDRSNLCLVNKDFALSQRYSVGYELTSLPYVIPVWDTSSKIIFILIAWRWLVRP